METPGKKVHLPPPPPPPPLPSLNSNPLNLETTQARNSEQESLSANSVYITADSHNAELEQLVNKLFDWNSIDGAAVIAVSRNVQHVPQSGPKCGLVALSMASSVCSRRTVDTSELLRLARDMELTNHGEMFSVDFMLRLVKAALPQCPASLVTHQLCDPSFVAEHLAAGDVFLVPYDSDRNFGPACLQGHKAHWAVLTGVLVPVSQLPSPSSQPRLLRLDPGPSSVSLLHSHLPAKVLVLALQGKSRHLSAWPLADLVASNANLIQVDPTREAGDIKYILPPGGVCMGLRGQALLICCVN